MGYTATMADNSGREQEQHLAQTATRSKRKLKGQVCIASELLHTTQKLYSTRLLIIIQKESPVRTALQRKLSMRRAVTRLYTG